MKSTILIPASYSSTESAKNARLKYNEDEQKQIYEISIKIHDAIKDGEFSTTVSFRPTKRVLYLLEREGYKYNDVSFHNEVEIFW